MPQTTRKMPSFEGVAAGQTATCRLPIGMTYHHLLITYTGVTLAQMDEVRVIANGEVIQRFVGGAVLDAMNQYNGRAAANGVLTLDFERYGLLTRPGIEMTALGTGHPEDPRPINTLTLEIDINSAATAPVLSCKAMQSAPKINGAILKVKQFNYNAGASGDYEIADLPRGDLYNKVFFKTGNVNKCKLERDNFIVFERTDAENDVVQADGKRVPSASYFVYDPTERGFGKESLVTAGVRDLRFTLNLSAPGAVPVIVESIGILEN